MGTSANFFFFLNSNFPVLAQDFIFLIVFSCSVLFFLFCIVLHCSLYIVPLHFQHIYFCLYSWLGRYDKYLFGLNLKLCRKRIVQMFMCASFFLTYVPSVHVFSWIISNWQIPQIQKLLIFQILLCIQDPSGYFDRKILMSATSADLKDVMQASISCELVTGWAKLQCHRKGLDLS